MAVVGWHVLLTGFWGGLMALERRAFLQAMVARPLVAGPVTGLLLEDVLAGLSVGLFFELWHLGGASLGGAHADHDTLPAVAGAALAATMGGGEATPAMWALAVLLTAPAGRAGVTLEHRLDARARKYFGRAVTAADAGDLRKAARQNLRAMWPQFVFYGLICAAAAAVGPVVAAGMRALPAPLVRGLGFAWPALGVLAAAVAVQGSHATARRTVAGVTAGVALVVGTALWAWGRSP